MTKASMQDLWDTSHLFAGNAPYLEEIYESYLKDPTSVSENWRHYFEQALKTNVQRKEPIHSDIQKQFFELARRPSQPKITPTPISSDTLFFERKQAQVNALIQAYRLLGHLHSNIDPLQMRKEEIVPELMLSYYHLSEADLETEFNSGSLPGSSKRSLKQIIQDLMTIYCGTIASEFLHIPDSPERVWVQERVENLLLKEPLTSEIKKHILERIIAAEGLEKYLGSKFPGAKRFSLEGLDTLIIALDELIQKSGSLGVKEIVIGMAHRGRLNVLMNILGKNPNQLFDEFEGKAKQDECLTSGDVKYHQGFSSDLTTGGGPVHVALAFNPSHLEIVSPVVCGSVRARQERRQDKNRKEVLSVNLHGDASFAGQGVDMETLNMSQTRAYAIGGTINIIVNNQIGFTTSDPKDARSTLYCSDLGKMIEIPIFHVNADDPEAVYHMTRIALDYRNKFNKDVIIDLVGYRRQGHNEADEPSATQPIMYQFIRKHPTVCEIYGQKLIEEGTLTKEELDEIENKYRDMLDKRQASLAHNRVPNHEPTEYSCNWDKFLNNDWRFKINTGVPLANLQSLGKRLEIFPQNFVLHPRVKKIMEERKKMTQGDILMDWGYAEIMAYATLLTEGYPVRMSGQDCCRGTFFHRQAVVHDQKTGYEYTPLQHLSDVQSAFTIYDSLLSEEAVLGFEYGYASSDPGKLVIWEAQFGDFANNAQVVIDQFISSGEQKWGRLCGLVLYLPHGYDGQGPEHSSGRIERYLQSCAEHNIQVCIPTTPAQMFHMLRRQMLRPMRKPLIVFTPKSLLRHKLAVSSLEELSTSAFKTVIGEIDDIVPQNVGRVVLCSGKVYYELLERRRSQNLNHIAIVRIEQLYPFPEIELKLELAKYPNAREVIWCQEEPQNQGAWYSSQHHLISCISTEQNLTYAGRKPSASPAVGYHHLHELQQEALVKEALYD